MCRKFGVSFQKYSKVLNKLRGGGGLAGEMKRKHYCALVENFDAFLWARNFSINRLYENLEQGHKIFTHALISQIQRYTNYKFK